VANRLIIKYQIKYIGNTIQRLRGWHLTHTDICYNTATMGPVSRVSVP